MCIVYDVSSSETIEKVCSVYIYNVYSTIYTLYCIYDCLILCGNFPLSLNNTCCILNNIITVL